MRTEESFICPRCGNQDPKYVGYRNGHPYCRKCVSFIGAEASRLPSSPKDSTLKLNYSLSEEQTKLSKRVIANFSHGVNTLVYAVCGAGKTELVYGVIAFALSKGLQVGFALPRRDVVSELFDRLRQAFPNDKVIAVYGEHTSCLTGDVIVLTTHQLYRYPHYFDLLIMDEIDAFPFRGNSVLHAMAKTSLSLQGHCVVMSATPSQETLAKFKTPQHDIVELRTRFHKKPIPVPTIVIRPSFWQPIFIAKRLHDYANNGKPCLVFAPTLSLCESLYRCLSALAKGGDYVHSQRIGRADIISSFKRHEKRYLVTTSVLERGITIENLQVIVFHSDDQHIYDASSLIQIAGRVGRKKEKPTGEAIFLAEKTTEDMSHAIKEIKFCNTFL